MLKIEEMSKVNKLITECKKCDLWKTRKKAVEGSGYVDSKLFFIGEAPGFNEDVQGLPFVGKAGKIFDSLLKSINLTRDNIFITNILKCRPPSNRDPLKKEIQMCTSYLDKQIEIIHPKIIITLGNHATAYIFEKFGLKSSKISKIHGELFKINTIYGNICIFPLYHPAAATYNPNMKEILVEDFKLLEKFQNIF